MPKLVQSMLKALGRQPSKQKLDGVDTGSGGGGSRREKGPKRRRSVLDADSFVFLPGDKAANYWGQVLNDENFPVSQLSSDYSVKAADMRRRKTHVGGLRRSDDNSGVQEVNVIRPRAQTSANVLVVPGEEGSPVHNGLVYNRRFSGTLVKRTSTDEVEDAALIHDYAFCVSERDRWSQDLSSRCIYDKLIRPPPSSSNNKTSTPKGGSISPVPQWRHPGDSTGQRWSRDSPKSRNEKEHISSHQRSQSVLILDERAKNRFVFKNQENLRSSSKQTVTSHHYCDLEPPTSARSEYSDPMDSIDWEQIRLRTWKGKTTSKMLTKRS